ncbi:hypothetical protein SCP_0500900 [Sparassis crispa]|uniref:Uncharacterized protein n=1 Tax=Sparassis crispa TaxID=139825 RepID=A0A401GLJ5_9APHY|nr:hypothetical protein SCP_0500900 [Sparassis crispa]GBE83046.1 hypothetical protein SCP_0500900 [Sparassis crispa]
MVPFNASFRNTVAPAELSTALSLPFQNELQLRSLIQSPSLGYIPVAFPMTFVPMDIQGRESSRAAPDHSVFPSSVSQPLVPIIPAFPLYPTQAPATDSHSSNMAYLSQLLFEASDPVPLEAARPSELSGYLTALGQRPASVMSFDPSMFSHSTNVLANESVNFMYHPPPVSFKTRYSDLAALTKRIRAAFAESVHLAERGMDGNAQSPVVTQAHMWASGSQDMVRMSCSHSLTETACHAGPYTQIQSPLLDNNALRDEDTDDEEELLTPSGDVSLFFDSVLDTSGSQAIFEKTVESIGPVNVAEEA